MQEFRILIPEKMKWVLAFVYVYMYALYASVSDCVHAIEIFMRHLFSSHVGIVVHTVHTGIIVICSSAAVPYCISVLLK